MFEAEARQAFFECVREMPGKNDRKSFDYFQKINEVKNKKEFIDLQNYTKYFSLDFKSSEIPEDINPEDLCLTMWLLSLRDSEVFDLKDKKTRSFVNEMKQQKKWSVGNQLCECAMLV